MSAQTDFQMEDVEVQRTSSGRVNWIRNLTIFVAVVVAITVILALTLKPTKTPSGRCSKQTCPDKCFAKAAVAADAGNCSKTGRDILQRNGSAVDAAIATLLCLSVINPQSMGIGGGVVFTIYNASTGEVVVINARETAPKNATENMFENDQQKEKPGLLIAVPGELRGYYEAYQRFGRLPWKELFNQSIGLAQKGFQIGKALAEAIKDSENDIRNNSALCKVFCDPNNNNTLKENYTLKLEKLAKTYEIIADKGPIEFYNGSLTQTIVDEIQAAGGIITREDLEDYKAEVKEYAINFTVGEYKFHVPDAPFGGPVLALILNILKGYNISNSSMSTEEIKTLTYHRIIEAFRFADAQKSKLGDPRDENISKVVTELVQNMTSDRFADEIRSKIKDDIKQTSYSDQYDPLLAEDHGTSHLSIIAEDGSAVAVTSSINDYFGSKVMSNSSGIIFNNQMSDFIYHALRYGNKSLNNRIKPGKRPLSSMCPTIILNKDSGQVKMVVGAEGGTNITTSVAQVILNYLFFGYDSKRAVKEPRVQIRQDKTHVEENFDKNVIAGLKRRNHIICNKTEPSVVQAVVRQGDEICAESDHRKYGSPAGY